MKEYFKYRYGYINIDVNNLYLTNSGNWQETESLPEKKAYKNRHPKHIGGNVLPLIKILPVAYIVASVTLSLQTEWYVGVIFWFFLIAILFIASRYVDLNTPYRIKIPLNKINTIEDFKDRLKVNFENAGNQPDFVIIEKPEEKGREFLNALLQ